MFKIIKPHPFPDAALVKGQYAWVSLRHVCLFHAIARQSASACDPACCVIQASGYPPVHAQNLTAGAFQFPNFRALPALRSNRGKCFQSKDGKRNLPVCGALHKCKTAPFRAQLGCNFSVRLTEERQDVLRVAVGDRQSSGLPAAAASAEPLRRVDSSFMSASTRRPIPFPSLPSAWKRSRPASRCDWRPRPDRQQRC